MVTAILYAALVVAYHSPPPIKILRKPHSPKTVDKRHIDTDQSYPAENVLSMAGAMILAAVLMHLSASSFLQIRTQIQYYLLLVTYFCTQSAFHVYFFIIGHTL